MLKFHVHSGAKRLVKPRFLAVLVLLSALIGWAQAAKPLELSLRFLWDKAYVQDASGSVALVGIDDQALTSIGPWPWRAAQLARLNDRLFEAGARRIVYDIPLLAIRDDAEASLLSSVESRRDRIFVSPDLNSRAQGAERVAAPMNGIGQHATLVNTNHWVEGFWNGVSSIFYRQQVGSSTLDAAESVISGVTGAEGEAFPVDYSYRLSSIPYFSAAELLSPGSDVALAGKDVVVGFNSQTVGRAVTIPGNGPQSSSLVLVLGAETLRAGRPIVVGWAPPLIVAVLVFLCVASSSRLRWLRAGAPVSLAILLGLPLLAASHHIFVEVIPSLFFLGGVTVRAAWRRFGDRQKNAGSINPLSGLPTPNAIRHDDGVTDRLLVAARVRNFAHVLSALPPQSEEELTRQVVRRLELAVGDGQLLHGDDGNFFWLADSSGFETIVEQFEALHVLFRSPVRVNNKSFDLDVSFGLDREVGMPLSHRMVTALAAAHAAEQEGICWKVHDPAASGDKEWLLSLLGELDDAIVGGRIWLAYQPKYELKGGRMIGAEALVRWTHETRGPISPSEFVEVAERHGRIGKLTAFVVEAALDTAKEALALDPDFQISVNISPSLLNDEAIFDVVMTPLGSKGLPPRCLMLEVTETAAIAKEQTAQALMKRFCAAGVGLSIDDYGTGLSTLEYLRKIPASELKIDRQFTRELCSSDVDQVVMRSTIELAHALGMRAVAEGIETGETLEILQEMGCDIGQGYHLARPMDRDSLLSTVKVDTNRTAAIG